MKKMGLTLLVLALFAYATTASAETMVEKIRSVFTGHDVSDHDSIKEDAGCCMMSNTFCLAEKCGDDHSFCLSDEAIKDLGITEQQRTKIRELCKETKEKIKERCKEIKRPEKGASNEDCVAYRKKMKEVCDGIYPECKAKLEKILGKEQIDKMQVRMFQYFGLVPSGIVLSVLDLSDDQKRELADICEDACNKAHKCMEEHHKSDKKDKEEVKAKIRECRNECAQKIRSVLNKDQLAKADRLLSETPEYVQKMKSEHDPFRTASAASQTR